MRNGSDAAAADERALLPAAEGVLLWSMRAWVLARCRAEELRIEARIEAALGGLDLVVGAVDRALETVRHHDVELASMVIADDDRIDGRYLEVHQGILSLLALQATVAGDLRVVAALLHLIKHVERMGGQCVNIAKLDPLAGHEPPTDPELLEEAADGGVRARSAGELTASAGTAIVVD